MARIPEDELERLKQEISLLRLGCIITTSGTTTPTPGGISFPTPSV